MTFASSSTPSPAHTISLVIHIKYEPNKETHSPILVTRHSLVTLALSQDGMGQGSGRVLLNTDKEIESLLVCLPACLPACPLLDIPHVIFVMATWEKLMFFLSVLWCVFLMLSFAIVNWNNYSSRYRQKHYCHAYFSVMGNLNDLIVPHKMVCVWYSND